MLLVAIVGSLLVIAALFVAGIAIAGWQKQKIEQIFAATDRPDARVHAKCMLRVFGLECPAVALATNDELILHPLVGRVRRVPLAHVSLKQETPGIGRSAWWNKRMFHLACPEEPLLVLGFANPAPWQTVFQSRPTSIAPPPPEHEKPSHPPNTPEFPAPPKALDP